MRSKKEQILLQALEAAACTNGFELVELELAGSGKAAMLRVYLDRPGGLNLDDIAAASAWINPVLEELDPYKGSYHLEVSSPGIDRPLRTPAHFAAAVGEEIAVTLEGVGITTGEGATAKTQRKLSGLLVQANDNSIIVKDSEGKQLELAFEDIKKAHVKGKVDFNQREEA